MGQESCHQIHLLAIAVANTAGVRQHIIRQIILDNVHCRPLRGCSTTTSIRPPIARTTVRSTAPTASGSTPASGWRCSGGLVPDVPAVLSAARKKKERTT